MPVETVKSLEERFIPGYWGYYLDLEGQLLATRRYVHFDRGNYQTYSLE